MGVMWGRRRSPCKPGSGPIHHARKALRHSLRAFMRQTVFGQEALPEVMSSQIIQEDVGENDKVK